MTDLIGGSVTTMETFMNEAQDFVKRVEASILQKDAIQLSGYHPKMTDYLNLFTRMTSSVADINVKSALYQVSQRFWNLVQEIDKILKESEEDKEIQITFPPVHSAGLGRPRKYIPVEDVRNLYDAGWSWRKIGKMFNISARTLRRHKFSLSLQTRGAKTGISDEDLDKIIKQIKIEHPTAGYVIVWGSLKAKNIFISFKRLKERMKKIDPLGIFERSRRRLKRRKYKVKGASYLWHMDGNEKLVFWKFYIHGCIDGYSRKIIYLKLAHNKRAEKVHSYFVEGIEENGIPIRVRSDGGTENVRVKDLMRAKRPTVVNPFIVGKSVHNIRIEKLWTEVNRLVSEKYRKIFFFLEGEGLLDLDSTVDLLCISYIYFNRINRGLHSLVSAWNEHGLSSVKSCLPIQLWIASHIRQKYLGNGPNSVQNVNVESFKTGLNTPYSIIEFRDILSDYPIELTDEQIDMIAIVFESIVPNPFFEDENDGKLLYVVLRHQIQQFMGTFHFPTCAVNEEDSN